MACGGSATTGPTPGATTPASIPFTRVGLPPAQSRGWWWLLVAFALGWIVGRNLVRR